MKINNNGMVLLKNEDGFVKEFVPESAEVWLESGWSLVDDDKEQDMDPILPDADDQKES